MKSIIEQRHQYVFVCAMQAGNAKDGLNYTGEYHLATKISSTELTTRYLTRAARDLFTGLMFNWSARSSRAMSRLGIEIVRYGTSGTLYNILYRGHYIGEIQVDSFCQCGDGWQGSHLTRDCATNNYVSDLEFELETRRLWALANAATNAAEYKALADAAEEHTRDNDRTYRPYRTYCAQQEGDDLAGE